MNIPFTGKTYTKPQLEAIVSSMKLELQTVVPVAFEDTEPKYERFTNTRVNFTPGTNDTVRVEISGIYRRSYKACHMGRDGIWRPGSEQKIAFRYSNEI